jgi:hypothetical protein
MEITSIPASKGLDEFQTGVLSKVQIRPLFAFNVTPRFRGAFQTFCENSNAPTQEKKGYLSVGSCRFQL